MKWIHSILFLIMSTFTFSQDYRITNYAVHIDVQESAILSVTEVIDVTFNKKKRGIIRGIPSSYAIKGKKRNVNIGDINVEGYKFKTTRKNKAYNIRIGSSNKYLTGNHTYAITYQVSNAIVDYDEYMEMYWNLAGSEWDVPIEKFNFTIDLPNHVGIDSSRMYVEQTSGPVSFTYVNHQMKANSINPIEPGEAMSVGIAFERNAFNLSVVDSSLASDKSKGRSLIQKLARDKGTPLPIALFMGLIFFWRIKGRTKIFDVPEGNRFYPPDNLSPAELGTYIDHHAHDRDIISLFPFWATNGLVSISQADDDIYVSKIQEMPSSYPGYQATMFNALFENTEILNLKSDQSRVRKAFAKTKSLINQDIRELNVYDPWSKKIFHGMMMTWLGILAVILGAVLIAVFQFFISGALFILLGLALGIIRSMRPKLSDTGQELLAKIKQFERTIDNLDNTNVQEVYSQDPSYFEKIFPYAMALGIDKKFSNKFEDVMEVPPTWYSTNQASGPVVFSDFSKSFDTKTIESKFTPSSSRNRGGGYRGGGGFSGGGMGGGGGSSW